MQFYMQALSFICTEGSETDENQVAKQQKVCKVEKDHNTCIMQSYAHVHCLIRSVEKYTIFHSFFAM